MRLLGLGLLVGAILQRPAQAQQTDTTRARADSIARARRDSVLRARADSLGRAHPDTAVSPIPAKPPVVLGGDTIPRGPVDTTAAVPLPVRDTIKAPLAHAPAPPLTDIGPEYRWPRDSIFASGALTLLDLLDRVPGVTTLSSGWLASPMTAAYTGSVARIRIFVDGLELVALDPRAQGILDLSQIPLWPYEEVRIERAAEEIRVYLRTWRVDNTTPYTRTDAATGDQNTNLYRGYFGRRYAHGEALQLGAQQFSTSPDRLGVASGDDLSAIGRLGWARGRWSVDAYFFRSHRTRGALVSQGLPITPLPATDETHTDAYLRAAVGDPDAGPWLQLIAGTMDFRRPKGPASGDTTQPQPEDTLRSRAQYVAMGGLTRFGIRLQGTERLWVFGGSRYHTPSLRASYDSRWLTLSAYAEHSDVPVDSVRSRADVSARLRPLSFLELAGSAGQIRDARAVGTSPTRYVRGEAGVRLGQLWLSGGALVRDSATLPAPQVYEDGLTPAVEGRATGTFAGVRGTIWKAVRADAIGIRWNGSGWYRPQYETRSQLYVSTRWLSRFPSGHFGFIASAEHDYRSNTLFPDTSGQALMAVGSRVLTTLIEIRILRASIFWQYRNLLGEDYEIVPGFPMPRQTNIYGVRWEFWN